MAIKTIGVSESVWEAIRAEGKMGESFDKVLRRKFGVKESKA